MRYTDDGSPAIEVRDLRKSFGTTPVLHGIDLDVPAGSVCALLGPNGAGKTTTVRILATLSRPDGGTARVAGHDVVTEADAVRRCISLTGQFAAVDEQQTGLENLVMVGQLWRLGRQGARRRAEALLEQFDLAAAGRRRVATYSGGMKRRLDLAMGLVASPRVVFLDEPTTGLDPTSRSATWDAVRALVDDGVTILLTTQYLEEADRLADQIVLLDGGRVVAGGDAASLKRAVGGARIEVHRADGVVDELPSDGSAEQLRRVLNDYAASGVAVTTVAQHEPTLDDVFVALTGTAHR